MGMLLHHTWLEQQKAEQEQKKKAVAPKAEAEKPEPVKEPVKKTGGRRKTK